MEPLQGLHTTHLIGAEHPLASPGQGGGLRVQAVDVGDLGLELFVVRRGQPGPDQVGSQAPGFLKASRHGEVR